VKRMITAASAAATALAVMAALSAASASAGTVICDGEANPCPASEIKPAGSYIITGDSEGFPGIKVSAGGSTEFECSQNTMEAVSKATIGSPLPAEFDGTLFGCIQQNESSCSGSMNKPPTTLEATATARYMKIGTAAEPLALTFSCPAESPTPYTCTYKLKDTLTLNLAESEIKALFRPMYLAAGSSSACSPSSPSLSVRNQDSGSDYISTYSPTGTVICKTAEEPCLNESNWYGAGTPLSAGLKSGTKATLTTPIIKSECSSSSLSGQLTGSGGKGQNVPFSITSASFTGCSNNVTLTVEGLPWTEGLISSVEPGKLGVMRFNNVRIKWSRLGITCTLGGQVDALVKNPSEITFQSSPLSFISGSGLCEKGSSTLSGSYDITAPNPFYLGWL
jgi:hypothetical protein